MKKEKGQLGDLREYADSLWFLLKWFMISVGVGVIVGGVSALFGHTLIFANNLRSQYPFYYLYTAHRLPFDRRPVSGQP